MKRQYDYEEEEEDADEGAYDGGNAAPYYVGGGHQDVRSVIAMRVRQLLQHAPPAKGRGLRVRGEFGLVGDLLAIRSRFGKNMMVHYPSRRHLGHIYRLGFHEAKGRSVFYCCSNCYKVDRSQRKFITVRAEDGMIVTDPDNPLEPHFCTDFIRFPMYTMGDVYAEQIIVAAIDEVRSANVRGTAIRKVYETARASIDDAVPEEFRQQARNAFPDWKSKRATFNRASREGRSKHEAAALEESLDADATGATASTSGETSAPAYGQPQPAACDPAQAPAHALLQPVAPFQLHWPAPFAPTATGGQAFAAAAQQQPQHQQQHHGQPAVSAARARPKKRHADGDKPAAGGQLQQQQASSFSSLSVPSRAIVDGAMKKILQRELLRHEQRVYAIKERVAEQEVEYSKLALDRDMQHKESVDQMNLEHLRSCNELARQRMRLENELLEVKRQKMLAELDRIRSGGAPAAQARDRRAKAEIGGESASDAADAADDVDTA